MTFPENIRDIAKIQYLEHVKRMPHIDWLMAQERLWRWQNWKDSAGRRDQAPPFLCHDQYSEEEKKIFAENKIKYCGGYCGDQCEYLKDDFTFSDLRSTILM